MTLSLVLMVATLTQASPAQRPDVVDEWIDRAVATGYRSGASPVANARNVALVAAALFDALNAVTPRFQPYRSQSAPRAGASPEAAAAAAAHWLLVRLYPDPAQTVEIAYQADLARVPDGAARTSGVELGERTAAALYEERQRDGSDAPVTYRPFTTAGTYVPTVLPAAPAWGSVRPFVLERGSQFRPAAPYALSSAQWAADYNEVRKLGAKTGSTRTAEQTEIARFWEYTGPGTYMPVARHVTAAKGLGLVEKARAYALVAMAGADALVAVFDAKYTYNFWRPVTAIRNGDQDGNDATERDAAWDPFIATPLHPEYPCAHCITQTAVATVLSTLYGDAVPFTLTSPTAPGVTRKYAKLSDYAAEVLNARVYDGVHYRTSGEVGAAMGRQIGVYIAEHALKPR